MTVRLENGDPTRVGPYELLGRLGVGGMGEVFLGRSAGGRLVAVKLVRSDLAADTTFRRRFTAEVTAARKVGGFYTAQVVDADPDGTPPWLATAYIPGLSLQQAITEHGPLPVGSAAMLGAGLAEGLLAVHEQDLVHRDLKPANVILAPDGPRLIDFGIARALDATSHTQTHTVLGTAAYMSPEQINGDRDIGPASDVFALGCVLVYATTGQSPFGSGPPTAIAFRVVHNDPDLDELAAVAEPLAELAIRCLAKNPDERPALASVLTELAALARDHRVDSPADDHRHSDDQTGWLPTDLTEAIARHATEVLRDPEMARTTPMGQPGRTSIDSASDHDDHDGARDHRDGGKEARSDPANETPDFEPPTGPGPSSTPGGSTDTRPGKGNGRSADSASPSLPRRVSVSALISLALLLCALVRLLTASGSDLLDDYVDGVASNPVAIAPGLLMGAVSAVVNVRLLGWFGRRVADRFGRSSMIALAGTSAAIGFLVPIPASYGLNQVLTEFGTRSSAYFASWLVTVALVIALVLEQTGRANATAPPVGGQNTATNRPWQAVAAGGICLLLLIYALHGLYWITYDTTFFDGLEDTIDGWIDNAPLIASVLMLAECTAGAYLAVRQFAVLMRSTMHRLGNTITILCTAAAGFVGFVSPFLAFQLLVNDLLRLTDGSFGAGRSWFTGFLLGVVLALGVGWQLESEKARRN